MAKREGRPLGSWRLEKTGEYFTDFCWECPFCGKVERYAFSKGHSGKFEDSLYDRDRCFHCGKDADGNTELNLYREGDCGYYGDGDFVWNGSWKGEKNVLVHRPFDFDRTGWYGEDRIPYDRPDIRLEVYAWTSGGGWLELEDGCLRRKKRRLKAYSATLKFVSWWHHSIRVVQSKRVKTLKQLHKEVAALDLSPYIPEMLKAFYDRGRSKCLWKFENDEWIPFMTSYGSIDGFSLPYGKYAEWDPHYKRYSMIERSAHCVSGWGMRDEDPPPPPAPWTMDGPESVIIPTDTRDVTKQLDSA